MGTGANVDIVVPHMTRSYADGGAADEGGGVPMCTLRNFPHLIDHCIEWARAKFEVFDWPSLLADESSSLINRSSSLINQSASVVD